MKEYKLECLGEACPVPLIKAQKKFEDLEKGDVLIINVDHSCTIKNIPEWAQEISWNCEVEEINEGEWNIIIEKGN